MQSSCLASLVASVSRREADLSFRSLFLLVALLAGSFAYAEKAPPHPQRRGPGPGRVAPAATGQKLEARKRFVLNVLQSAIALPQNDPQDRLRVLLSAARVASAVSAELSRALAKQGIELETQIISTGQKPAVSMLESGLVDCTAVAGFVDAVRPEALASAEQSLTAAISSCPRQALEGVKRRLAGGQGSAAPRLMLAAMHAAGLHSAWTAQQASDTFSSLPDAERSVPSAPVLADMYAEISSAVDAAAARSSGLNLLIWLGKMPTSPERVQAITTVTAAMKKSLGEERYQDALQSDVMAAQAAQQAGGAFEVPPPDEESSVLVSRLMGEKEDMTGALEELPATRRAREAAAYGFATGGRDAALAQRYFEIAFRALDDVWSNRRPGQDVVAIVEEVSQAAAHVNAIQALSRAERLQDSAAQAIGMLTVAQVVLAKQQTTRPAAVPAQ